MEGRSIGLDVHRDFCEIAICQADGRVRRGPRIATRPDALGEFAEQLGRQDRVAMEATGNALQIARIIRPYVKQVIVANTRRLAAIAEAKNRPTDATRAHSLSCFTPGCWKTAGSPTRRFGRCGAGPRGAPSSSVTVPASRTRSSRCCSATSSPGRR